MVEEELTVGFVDMAEGAEVAGRFALGDEMRRPQAGNDLMPSVRCGPS